MEKIENMFCHINKECVTATLHLANHNNPVEITMESYLQVENKEELNLILEDNNFKYYKELPDGYSISFLAE